MKIFKPVLIIVSLSFVNTLYAATDYNSSRSNKNGSGSAFNDTTSLVRKVSADALAVSKRMIEVDQRDEFDGDYLITVEMRVSLQRCVKVEDQPETVCTDIP